MKIILNDDREVIRCIKNVKKLKALINLKTFQSLLTEHRGRVGVNELNRRLANDETN